jgi:serpin B
MQSTSTDFSFKLFQEQAQDNSKNVLVSPFSAYIALSMTLNGAAAGTRDDMAKVLGTESDAIGRLNERNAGVIKSLAGNDKVQLEIANAIYADTRTPFKKEFVELCQQSYKAEAHSESFSDPTALKKINQWCSDKTHGKIAEILKKLNPREKLVLLNAIYFKGSWRDQFKENDTRDDQFTTPSGDKIPIKMMHEQIKTLYCQGTKFRSLALSYAGNKQRLYIFMPDENVDMLTFIAQLNKTNWESWMKSYRTATVQLSLPKFKIEDSSLFNDALQKMGMAGAFEPSANFSNMTAVQAWISRVLQKTYMDVNESGTEAAAVTAVLMEGRAMTSRPEPVVEFRVDRPFVLALVDQPTGEILFLGAVNRP